MLLSRSYPFPNHSAPLHPFQGLLKPQADNPFPPSLLRSTPTFHRPAQHWNFLSDFQFAGPDLVWDANEVSIMIKYGIKLTCCSKKNTSIIDRPLQAFIKALSAHIKLSALVKLQETFMVSWRYRRYRLCCIKH